MVRARLGLMRPRLAGALMSSWGKVGGRGADPSPSLGSSPSAGWCPYRPIFHSFIQYVAPFRSPPVALICGDSLLQAPPRPPPTPHPRMLVRNADLIMSLPPQGLQRLPAPSWIEVHRPFELSLTCPSGP